VEDSDVQREPKPGSIPTTIQYTDLSLLKFWVIDLMCAGKWSYIDGQHLR